MASGYYYCVPHPLPLLKSHDELVDTGLKINAHSNLFRVLLRWMNDECTRLAALSTPTQKPKSFDRSAKPLASRLPAEYVDDLEALLSQAKSPRVLVVALKDGPTTALVDATKRYESVALSFFVQSVQQINPTAGILYEMIGQPPAHGKGTFVDCETSNCCFRHVVVRLVEANKRDGSTHTLALNVRPHECSSNNPGKYPVDTMMKWLQCSPVDYLK
ncbi:hypothetical protein ElyMa_005789400 [Elysia marginata]|uniref:Uncharacterized protein n=1 Tax=Elysia marginata TaxID=1093978 RepID=A0AAV4FRN4_9GAST|nr:hypothetical protein ElyMa_005789400 [Elysia marginata]